MSELEQDKLGQGALGGGWLGTYAYKGRLQAQPPVRFDATFYQSDGGGSFFGTILDDGGLGEADMRGEQSGQGIRFAKDYRQSRMPLVSYEGTLSEDSRTMAGTWRIDRTAHGVWDARRTWSDSSLSAEDETEESAESELDTDWDRPRVREVVRLG